MVVGQGQNIYEALESVSQGTPIHMAVFSFASDAEALREIRGFAGCRVAHPGIKLVVLADLDQHDVLLAALEAGVEALLSRDISSDVLQRSLELVQLGQRLVPKELLRLLLDPAHRLPPARPAVQDSLAAQFDQGRAASLTPREGQILHCLMDGRSNKEIARELHLTEATVKAHVKALLRKTRMTNRTQAAIWAVTNNFQIGAGQESEAFCAAVHPDFVVPDLQSAREKSAASESR